MASNRAPVLVVAAVVIVAAVAAVFLAQSGEQKAPTNEGPTAEVLVTEGDFYVTFEGQGDTVQKVLQDALGEDVVFSEDGTIQSYKGTPNADDHRWTVYRWKTPEGWVDAGDTVIEGMTFSLDYSEPGQVPGYDVYKEAYFFIQVPSTEDLATSLSGEVRDNYDKLSEWLDLAGMTVEDIEEGFWIKGQGRCVNEALADAVHVCMYPTLMYERVEDSDSVDYYLDGNVFHSHGIRADMYGWFLDFLGWSDVDLHNGDFTYWSQYSYNPNAPTLDDGRQWTFDDWALGMYDMDRYRYFGLVLQTTQEDGTSKVLPTPDTIPEGL